VAGPPRRLSFDFSRFESHLAELLKRFPGAAVDFRGDADGVGIDALAEVLERVSRRTATASTSLSIVRDDDTPPAALIPAEQIFGVADGGAGFATFSGTVVNVKRVPAGRRISYGYTYATTSDSTLALVGLGYADGAVRRASSRAPVHIGSHIGVIAGRIAMDQLVVDMGDAHVAPGDVATLWGDPARGHPSIATWSELTGIPALALMSAVGFRVERVAHDTTEVSS